MNNAFEFPASLTDKYQPKSLDEFIGIERVKAVIGSFVKAPRSTSFLFKGPSGTGKTSMAQWMAAAIPAELIHVSSRKCDLAMVDEIARKCHYVPFGGKFWLVLVDEADLMTRPAQDAFLSKLDSTEFPPNTIFVFTANSTANLETRFLSRCLKLDFEAASTEKAIPEFLKAVWEREAGKAGNLDFAEIANGAGGNVRDALSRLEIELMVNSSMEAAAVVPEPPAKPAKAKADKRQAVPKVASADRIAALRSLYPESPVLAEMGVA